MFTKNQILSLALSALGVTSFAQTGVYRTPALSPDAKTIAFSFQGDIWTMPLSGSKPERLTLHQAYESNPVFSPNGKQLAFNSERHGNNDLFVMDADGGNLDRITYHSSNDVLSDWSAKNNLVFSTVRAYRQLEWDEEIHQVSAMGGTPSRWLNALGEMATVSPNGKMVAFVRGACRVTRENYKGPSDLEIWIYHTESKTYTQLTNNTYNDLLPRWNSDNELYFLSGETGYYNIYKQTVSGKAKTAVTNLKGHGIRYFDMAQQTIVYERGMDLFTLNLSDGNGRKLDINIKADYRFDPIEKKTYSSSLNEYEVSPNGKELAFVVRGEVFVKELDKEKTKSINLSNHAFRDGSVAWLNDTTLLLVSDRDGVKNIYKVVSNDPKTSSLAKALRHTLSPLVKNKWNDNGLLLSPNGKKIAFTRDNRELIVADILESGKLSKERVMADSWSLPRGVVWSPDSRNLAYSQQDLTFNNEIFIHPIDGDPVNVSMHPKGDYSPYWSADGSKLGFVSNRGAGGDSNIWFAWLRHSDWEKTKEDWKDGSYYDEPEKPKADAKEKKKDEAKDKEPEEEIIEIDLDNIHDRLMQVTSLGGNEGSLIISADGETFYFSARPITAKSTDWYKVKWDGSKIEQLTKGGQGLYAFSADPAGKDFYAMRRGGLVKVDGKGKTTGMPFLATMHINHALERDYVFEEGWMALNQRFYDPNFHGNDWNALKAQYKPWAMAASTAQDFRLIFSWMLGRLNASHLGMYGGNPEETQRERTGKLGIEVSPVAKGVEVKHIVLNSPAGKGNNALKVGDVIVSVNDKPIETGTNFYELLEGESGNEIWLSVKGNDGKSRDVIVRTTTTLGTLLYEEWVAERQRLVTEYSDGRLGYIHIRGMNMPSFERFERELMASGYGKEGIVIDVRFNGGGWTTDYLMAVLNVKQHAYTVPRGATDNLEKNHAQFKDYYPYSERLPLTAWTAPSIALCNESSYSNAEIFSHAYKNLGLGTLVGQPTFGAVISTSGTGLLDGSFVRLPFRGWYVKADGTNMENGPAVPDVLIHNSPDYRAKQIDEQLKKAVELLLKDLEK